MSDPRAPELRPEAMESDEQVPVVIVGAGPVGVTAGLLLARYGVRTLLLERHRDVYPLPRAVALDDEVSRILQSAGVAAQLAGITRPARGLRLLDARHRVLAEFRRDAEQGHHGHRELSMFDQPELEALLRQALHDRPESELRSGVEVLAVEQPPRTPPHDPAAPAAPAGPAGPVRVRYRAADDPDAPVREVAAAAVLGCDGTNSLVRRSLGIDWEDLRFEERWMVVDGRTDAPVRTWEGVDQVCDPARAGTFMRIGADRYRWEFRLADDETVGGPGADARLRRLLAPWIAEPDQHRLELLRRTEYTFRARVATRWRSGRVFLLGDAAHLTPPFIGQGMGAGLRDAANLAWKLARVLDGGGDEALLDSYQAERRPHARRLIRAAVAMGWAMTGGQDRAAAARRIALGTLFRVPGVSALAARQGTTAVPLAPGPLVRRGTPLAGLPCPQPYVRAAGPNGPNGPDGPDGPPQRLDELLGDGFAVLTLRPLPARAAAVAAALDAPVLHVHPPEPAPAPPDDGAAVLHDAEALRVWMRRARISAVLLRPDRVVLGTLPLAEHGGEDDFGAAAWAPLLGPAHPRPQPPATPAPPPPTPGQCRQRPYPPS